MLVGEYIKGLRRALGVTQDELADKVGINRATLSKYESGHIEPPLSALVSIARALKMPTSFFLGEDTQSLANDLQSRIASTIRERISFELSIADPEDLAEVFGTSNTDGIFGDIFERRIPLSLSRLEDVADQLGVPVDYLLGQLDDPTIPERSVQEQQQFQKLSLAFDRLNWTGQTVAIERVKELAEIQKYQKTVQETKTPAPGKTEDGSENE